MVSNTQPPTSSHPRDRLHRYIPVLNIFTTTGPGDLIRASAYGFIRTSLRSFRKAWSLQGEPALIGAIADSRSVFAECVLDHCLWDIYTLARPTPNHPEAGRIVSLLCDSADTRHKQDGLRTAVNHRYTLSPLFKRIVEANGVQLCECRGPQRAPGSRKELERGCFGTMLALARLEDNTRDAVLRRLPLIKEVITGWRTSHAESRRCVTIFLSTVSVTFVIVC